MAVWVDGQNRELKKAEFDAVGNSFVAISLILFKISLQLVQEGSSSLSTISNHQSVDSGDSFR